MRNLLPLLVLLIFSCSEKKQEKQPVNNKPAATKVLLQQPKFQLEYFSDWTIDSGSGANSLQLNAPSKSSFATVLTFKKQVNEKEYVDQQVGNFVPRAIKDAVVSDFSQMGSYTGYGKKIEGYLEFKKIELKIFAGKQDTASFALMTQLLVPSRATDEPGLQLVESSFKMKK